MTPRARAQIQALMVAAVAVATTTSLSIGQKRLYEDGLVDRGATLGVKLVFGLARPALELCVSLTGTSW